MDKTFERLLLKELKKSFGSDKNKMLSDINNFIQNYKEVDNVSIPKGSSKIIEIKDVSKVYKVGGDIINALKNINLDVYEGEIVAIMGSSGSGKSTLLNLIGGLDKPTTGTIRVGEYDIGKLKDKDLSSFRNKMIGFVFQSFYLQPYLNVLENIEIPLIFGQVPLKIRREKSLISLKSMALTERLKHLPSQLSGGEMQRVAIARAMVNSPKLLLADEPTGNLDRKTGFDILDLIEKLNKEEGMTVIIVTHDDEVASRANRVMTMYDGELTD